MNSILANRLVSTLRDKKMHIAHAESCTGGLLSKYITDQPGASDVFECGIVSYSGRIKHNLLGVSCKTIELYGEVSEETAREMALGIKDLSEADIGIGITGIAGPGGGTPTKPVGLVYFAVSYADKCDCVRLELFDIGDRQAVREETVRRVLEHLLRII